MAHDIEVVGSNPGTVYWMDVSDASYYINIQENNENEGSQMGHTQKKYFKTYFILIPYLDEAAVLVFIRLLCPALLEFKLSHMETLVYILRYFDMKNTKT
jgi:hypothetical protein